MYFYYGDIYDNFFLPFYINRDLIEAYVKVVITNEGGVKHYKYYISMTDFTYGYPEISADELSFSTITNYCQLDLSFEQEKNVKYLQMLEKYKKFYYN